MTAAAKAKLRPLRKRWRINCCRPAFVSTVLRRDIRRKRLVRIKVFPTEACTKPRIWRR